MSHTPALEKIREQAVRIGAVPHLLTQSADGRPHAVAVEIAWDEDALRLTAGKRSATNVATQRLVSVRSEEHTLNSSHPRLSRMPSSA